jgi:probable selenate reductase molybdenum-binding subunit
VSKQTKAFNVIGRNVEKVDGLALACGAPAYVDDVAPRSTLHGAILYSPHAHARIERIDTSRAEALDGVRAVLHHGNVPRVLHTTAGQGAPEPSPYDTVLFDDKVRFVGDRVAAVAAVSREVAAAALEEIEVEYDELEPVLDPRTADADGAPVIHDEGDAHVVIPVTYQPERNVAAGVDARVGDVQAALEAAAVRVAGEYETQYAQHTPLEPHICVSYFEPNGRLVIVTSTQVPFHARRIVAQVCGLPERKIRVIKPRIGGGFGAKQEVFLEQLCAMLTLRTGQPVKIELSRAEEFVSSRTRHPAIVRVEAGFDANGRIQAIDMRVRTNTGAYGSHALTVASNCGSKVLPLYPCDNVAFVADSVYTNLPVGGAYRGYGATQAAFAMECVMDEAAEKLEIDPVDLRLQNHIRSGGSSPVFRMLGEGTEGVEQTVGSCGLDECIRRGADAIGWWTREPRGDGPVLRGYGFACGMQGSSIPKIDMGAASMKMNEDGSFNLLVGATDLGTGSDTVLAQIAAEVLGIGVDKVIVYSSDTDMTPFDVGAYASSTTYLSGHAVKKVAEKIAEQIKAVAGEMLDCDPGELSLGHDKALAADGSSVTLSQVARRSLYSESQHQIAAFSSHVTEKSPPPFAAHFVEVAVDTETGFVAVPRYVCAVDCGTAIHPRLAEGQAEGALLNGLSYALTERYIFDERGKMLNPSFRNYKIYGVADLPEITTILVPSYEESGPFGAKSISEICINGAQAAVSNAIFDAVGVRLRTAPFTPERVLTAIIDND